MTNQPGPEFDEREYERIQAETDAERAYSYAMWEDRRKKRFEMNQSIAEILLGSRLLPNISPYRSFSSEDTFSLIIDGEYLGGSKRPTFGREPMNIGLIEQACAFAETMQKNGVVDYKITNGERIRYTNDERVEVRRMSEDRVELFKQTLDTKLKEIKSAPEKALTID